MAVNQGNNGGSNPPPAGTMSDALRAGGVGPGQFGGQSQQQSQSRNQSHRSPGQQPDILSLNSLLGGPMARSAAAGHVIGYQKAINAKLDESLNEQARKEFHVHVMDRSQGIALSTILLCYGINHGGQNHVAVYSFVVEASADSRIPSAYVNIGHQSVEIERTAGDTANDVLWQKTVLFLREQYGQSTVFHDAGSSPLPSELSPEDQDKMYQITFSATQALNTVMESDVTGATVAFSVKMAEGANVTATLDPNPAPLFNAVGQPVRSDLSVTVRASAANANQANLHEQSLDLTMVNGFMDLIYSKPQPPGPYQPPITQHYYPRYVITHLDTRVRAITLELYLLGLASAPLIGRNWAWTNAFLPRYTEGNGPDLYDIGALGYEVNVTNDPQALPERIPTKSDSFGRVQLFELLNRLIHNEVVYSMDVEESGPLAWMTQTFIAAAHNNTEAYRAIVEAANNLTNGVFSQMWNNGPIAQDDNNRIHLGYYVDAQSRKRDIRDLGYLGMLNMLGEKDKPAFDEWVATYEQSDVPLELRLSTRMKILNAVTRNQFTLKGYARRITFTRDFIGILDAAIQQAGLVIRPNNVQILEGQGPQRGSFNAAQFAVNNQVGNGLFSYGNSPYGNFRSTLGSGYSGQRFGG